MFVGIADTFVVSFSGEADVSGGLERARPQSSSGVLKKVKLSSVVTLPERQSG